MAKTTITCSPVFRHLNCFIPLLMHQLITSNIIDPSKLSAGKCMLKSDVNRCQLPYYIFRSQHVKGKYNHSNECDSVLH